MEKQLDVEEQKDGKEPADMEEHAYTIEHAYTKEHVYMKEPAYMKEYTCIDEPAAPDERKSFYRDTWAGVDLNGIAENIGLIKQRLPDEVAVMAVVKANAYGHGAVQVAETALRAGAAYLAVALLDEALELRENGINAPILVLGATRAKDARLAARQRITVTVFQASWVEEAKKHLQADDQLLVHIKLDTGMGRLGIRDGKDLQAIERMLRADSRFCFEGIFTHFSTADGSDDAYFKAQFQTFQRLLRLLDEQPKVVHCSNSAAALRFSQANCNMVRLGIVMYGLAPSPAVKQNLRLGLKEAFSLHTKLVHVQKLPRGEKVGYGAAYETPDAEWIGTIPIGYADGWTRRLTGQEVLVNGERMPIVGKICMDQCMIRLPHELAVGTTVTLIGRSGGEFISVDEIAAKLETINYEIPCMISARVPRIYGSMNKKTDGRCPR